MKLEQIHIHNYRLLTDATIRFEDGITMLVGQNNAGKTSFVNLMYAACQDTSPLDYYDYPLSERKKLFDLLTRFSNGEIKYTALLDEIPQTSIEFFFNYEDEGEDGDLGALGEFIIDVDDNITRAHVLVKYVFTMPEEALRTLLASAQNETALENVCILNFKKMFDKRIYIKNAASSETEINTTATQASFQRLMPLRFISAERNLGESMDGTHNSLSAMINDLYNKDISLLGDQKQENVKEFRKYIDKQQAEIQSDGNAKLNKAVVAAGKLGYPNCEETILALRTQVDFKEIIKTSTHLTYKMNDGDLPSHYNGLGYKNLIKLELEISAYINELIENDYKQVPLLVIEEPESHMHPQMHHNFASYVTEFINRYQNDIYGKDSEKLLKKIQVIITTHSPHIANAVDFSAIRYIKKKNNRVEVKDLNDFCNDSDKSKLVFLNKYLTLSRCDIYFANKVIFIEGASERILLPYMIEKCEEKSELGKNLLSAQYYTAIEVGGAHAYIFIPLMEFLEIPYLIITDIDFINDENQKCDWTQAVKTSNNTIKWWMKNVCKKDNYSIKDLLSLTEEAKTHCNGHLEFQVPEEGREECARTFEDAIKYANDSQEYFKDELQRGKVDYALNLITREEGLNTPRYIKQGLKWLAEQNNG